VFNITLAAGEIRFLDQIGVARQVLIPNTIMSQNPLIQFGPDGNPFRAASLQSVIIRPGGEFDEFRIGGLGIGASGTLVFSPCDEFIVRRSG